MFDRRKPVHPYSRTTPSQQWADRERIRRMIAEKVAEEESEGQDELSKGELGFCPPLGKIGSGYLW